jgi:beta-phosphoglucomutase-like phosphatase (HAD superfamily)
VVEDTATGAEAANRAGMKVFALLNGLNSKDDFESVGVEGYIADLAQLSKALDIK